MNYLKLILAVFYLFILSTCTEERLDEEFPIVVTTIDENNFFIRGTYDGTPYEIRHLNESERHDPNIYLRSIQTTFLKKTNDEPYFFTRLTLAISNYRDDSLAFEEVIRLGEFELYQDSFITPSSSLHWYLPSIGISPINGDVHSRVNDPLFDKIEITEISMIDFFNDPNQVPSSQEGQLYNVKGSFQVKLKTEEGEIKELIIDEFSTMFIKE